MVTALVAAPTVAAQDPSDPPDGTGSTSTSTTTTRPPSSSSTTSTTAPTTTVPYVPSIPPELEGDPRVPFLVDPGPADGADIPIAQHSFDPLSVSVRPELVAEAAEAVRLATTLLEATQADVLEAAAEVTRRTAELDELGSESRAAVEAAAAARKQLIERAVTAYVVGDLEGRLASLQVDDMVDLGVARNYVGVVVDGNQRLVNRYERLRRGLSRDQADLTEQLAVARVDLAEATDAVVPAFENLTERVRELEAYQAGAQAYIGGFVFPVAGDVEFIDSWGYPRMTGTASEHWHQGTDVFAQYGTPLIAAENGVLERVGVGSLGGNKLWVRGESGVEYYYAHLAAFAPGVADGRPVRAGEVVGYVGDTGNARGTSPHLHFEIHPGGVGPINPYPVLKAAYGNRPTQRATAPVTAPVAAAPPPAPQPGG